MSATAKKIRNRAGELTYNNPESANYTPYSQMADAREKTGA